MASGWSRICEQLGLIDASPADDVTIPLLDNDVVGQVEPAANERSIPIKDPEPKVKPKLADKPPKEGCCKKCICCLPRFLWYFFRRCILVDLTFQFTWSKLLYGACVLEVTRTLSEVSLAQIFGNFDGGGQCQSNRDIHMCAPGGLTVPTLDFELLVDPIEDQSLSLTQREVYVVLVIVFLCVANSRYFERLWRIPTLLIYAFALQGLFTLVSFQIQDTKSCVTLNELKWDHFSLPPPGWSESKTEAYEQSLSIAEWCVAAPLDFVRGQSGNPALTWLPYKALKDYSANHHNKTSLTQRPSEEELHQRLMVMDSVKELWAGYMSDITFVWNPLLFCRHFNYSATDCVLEVKSRTNKAGKLELSGEQMVLNYVGFGSGLVNADVVTYHLLHLAQHGIGCKNSWEFEVVYEHGCIYSTAFLELDSSNKLTVKDTAREYLDESYFKCAVDSIQECASRSYVKARSIFRSSCGFLSCIFLCIGFFRMTYLRLSFHYPSCFKRLRGEWNPVSAERFRIIFGSRIVLALFTCALLQTSVTITLISLIWPLHATIDKYVATALGFPSAYFATWSIIGLFVLQWMMVVGVGVISNMREHFKMRSQIMRLRPEQFFGEEAPPDDWVGPDLAEMRELGKNSVLYASYFTGFVYWRFLISSFILAVCVYIPVVVVWYLWYSTHEAGHLSKAHKLASQNVWLIFIGLLFSVAILMVHYFARLWITKCLLLQSEQGMKIRCHCLWTYCELFTCILSLAVGPFSAFLDFQKGALCTLLAMLIVAKPNFTQFGELCDYVYCTYCAELYLERVYEDRLTLGRQNADLAEDPDEFHKTVSGHVELKHFGSVINLEEHHHLLEYETRPMLSQPSFYWQCPIYFFGFFLILLGLPWLASASLDILSIFCGYPCPCILEWEFMPKVCDHCDTDGLKFVKDALADFKNRIQVFQKYQGAIPGGTGR